MLCHFSSSLFTLCAINYSSREPDQNIVSHFADSLLSFLRSQEQRSVFTWKDKEKRNSFQNSS